MSSGMFMNTQELETAHELSVKSYSSTNNNSFGASNNNKNAPTPLVKKTKSKVKTNNGKRFFNNPYYAGTPLATLAAAVKKNNAKTSNSGNTSATKLAARAYKHQLQAYQAAQARLAAEREQEDQQAVDIIVSAESSLSRGATLGNFTDDQQQQQPMITCSPPPTIMPCLEQPTSTQMSKNNSSFLCDRQDSSVAYQPQQPSFYTHQQPQQQQGSYELENFSFTSQHFITANPSPIPQQQQQQQPLIFQHQQPQQPQFLTANNNNQAHQNMFNQSVSGLSSSSGAGSEDERLMMQQMNNNNSFHQQKQQQHQDASFAPPAPKSQQKNDNNNSKFNYEPNTCFVVVMFKYELCTFQCKFVVCEGDWVVVQADRGEHVGRVHSVSQEAPVFHVPYSILRHANFTEIASIEANRPREQEAGARIHQIAMDLQLPLAITDTEFYADGNKMTVFFSSKSTVDFRELQRRVFREFRRRIWLINNAEVQYRNRNCRNRK